MLILSFKELNNEFGIDNEPVSSIRIKDIGKDISLTPIEIIMRDEKPEMINETNFNIIVNLHPSDGTHWVLVIRRGDRKVYYFDSFSVQTPPLFLEEYVDLGSNERIQEYDESYCGAYCLYMIYLADMGLRIKRALDTLVNQVKCPNEYKKCQCLGCKPKGKVGAEVDVNQETCFVDVNDNVNYNGNVNDNVNDNGNGNDNDNINEVTCFADYNDDDKYISIFSERDEVLGSPTKQRDKPCSQCGCGGVSSVGGRPSGNSFSPKTSGIVSSIKGI